MKSSIKKVLNTLSIAALLLAAAAPGAHAAGPTDSRNSPPLEYHGGPVVTKAKNYLIFWTGGNKKAFDSKYVSVLQQWQKDARHITVFKATNQYDQADGKHPTDTTLAGTFYNNSLFPDYGCQNKCVMNDDIIRIARSTAAANRIAPGVGNIVYVYTPRDVRRCWGIAPVVGGNSTCDEGNYGRGGGDYFGYCGTRHNIPVNGKQLNMVYVNYPGPRCYMADGSQRFPNGTAVDAAVNLTANYQMEVITNPLGTAWYVMPYGDVVEISSQCRTFFGPRLPQRQGNSHYNGRTYDVHAMGSNKEQGCVVGSRTNGF